MKILNQLHDKSNSSIARDLLYDTPVIIFSFNRDKLLLNAVDSFLKLAPDFPIYIFDDASDSREMKILLSKLLLEKKVKDVFSPPTVYSDGEISSRGGLYKNMQYAYEFLCNKGCKSAVFAQDDMQLVRPLAQRDLEEYMLVFSKYKSIYQVDLRFDKSMEDRSIEGLGWKRLGDHRVAVNKLENKYSGFSAVGFFCLEKMKDRNWAFKKTEVENDGEARKKNLIRARALDPYMMHTPWPTTFKRRKRSILIIVMDIFLGYGCHPYSTMDPKQVESLISRSPKDFASARRWLCLKNRNTKKKWHFLGSDRAIVRRLMHLKAFLGFEKSK